jgi:hypothetical protein
MNSLSWKKEFNLRNSALEKFAWKLPLSIVSQRQLSLINRVVSSAWQPDIFVTVFFCFCVSTFSHDDSRNRRHFGLPSRWKRLMINVRMVCVTPRKSFSEVFSTSSLDHGLDSREIYGFHLTQRKKQQWK